MLLQIKIKDQRETLTNKDSDHKDKQIFNELVKKTFDKIIELIFEINQNDLIYFLKVVALERDLMIPIME